MRVFSLPMLVAIFLLASAPLNAAPKDVPIVDLQPNASTAPIITAIDRTHYAAALDKLKAGNLAAIDFVWLRRMHLRLNNYHDADWQTTLQPVFTALDRQDYTAALANVDALLKDDMVDFPAYFMSSIALGKLNRLVERDQRRSIVSAFYDAIRKGRDGHSAAQSWEVVSIHEEYFVLEMNSLKVTGQSLVNLDGHNYDKIDCTNTRTGKAETIWFNIDNFYGHELG